MAALRAPGTSSRLHLSSAARVAASIQRHTERIQRANSQRLAANHPRRPASGSLIAAARSNKPSVAVPSPRTAWTPLPRISGSSRIPFPPADRPVTRLLDQDITTSRIPIVRRAHAPGTALQLTSCLRNTANTVRPLKTVHFNFSEHTSIAQVRRYVPNDSLECKAPFPGVNCCPTIPGNRRLVQRSDGALYLIKQNGLFPPPELANPGTKGPDGQEGRCPYCSLNAAFGRFLPGFPFDDEDLDYPYDSIYYFWNLECEMLRCEDHQEWN